MVTYQEILMGRVQFNDLPIEIKINLLELITRINIVRALYGKPLIVSSGYRRPEDNANAGGAKKSAHLTCEAVDFYDPDGDFARWCINNEKVLKSIGIYMENPRKTKGWVHLQIRPTLSGKTIFDP